MELPKNITQIGVPDKKIKIYVEDYVVSYMKQFNLVASDKEMAIAMYGNRKKEDDLTYLFIYGAVKLDLIQKETKKLSKTQMEEIQHSGQLHFPEYMFLAYCLLNGEMVEGMYVCEEDRANYVSGYAQFYEKNDKMLALLIESRGEKIKPEIVDMDKYEMVRRRQEERRNQPADWRKTEGQANDNEKSSIRGKWNRRNDDDSNNNRRNDNGQNDDERNDNRRNDDGRNNNGRKDDGRNNEKNDNGRNDNGRKDNREDINGKDAGRNERIEETRSTKRGFSRMAAGIAVATLLGAFAYNSFDGQLDWRNMMKQVMEDFGEQKLSDLVAASGSSSTSDPTNDEVELANDQGEKLMAEADGEQTSANQGAKLEQGTELDQGAKLEQGTELDQGAKSDQGTELDQGAKPDQEAKIDLVANPDRGSEINEGLGNNIGLGNDMGLGNDQRLGNDQGFLHGISEIANMAMQTDSDNVIQENAGQIIQDQENVESQINDIVQENIENTTEGSGKDYIVLPGDTLNGISLQIYHTVNKVDEICSLNQIDNPDEIKEGQKIILP